MSIIDEDRQNARLQAALDMLVSLNESVCANAAIHGHGAQYVRSADLFLECERSV
jgi:hypothetical protein